MPTPTITRPGLRMVEAADLGACLVVAQSKRGDDQVLVVVSADEPSAMLRGLARPILEAEHRRHLSRFLDLRRKR